MLFDKERSLVPLLFTKLTWLLVVYALSPDFLNLLSQGTWTLFILE